MLRHEGSRFGIALAVILGFYVLGAASEGPLIRTVSALGSAALVALVALSPPTPRPLRRVAFAAIAVGVLAGVAAGVADADSTWLGVAFLATAAVLCVAILAVLAVILTHERVTASTVMGGLVAYTVLAFVFTYVYRAVDVLQTADFFVQGPVDSGVYSYFAFVTQTTVGFGDYTAATELGQRLVAVQALLGQVFLVVLVARLVSLWGQPLRRDELRGPPS